MKRTYYQVPTPSSDLGFASKKDLYFSEFQVCPEGLREFFNIPDDAKNITLVVSSRASANSCRVELHKKPFIKVDGWTVTAMYTVYELVRQLGPVYVSCYYE